MGLATIALALLLPAIAVAQDISSATVDQLEAELTEKRTAEKLAPVNEAKAEELAWLKITFSTDKSGEGRVGNEAIDGAEVTLTPDDPEFAKVLAEALKAAGRKAE